MKKITDWQDKEYLLSKVVFDWSELAQKSYDGNEEAVFALCDKLKTLSGTILRKKNYSLVWEYFSCPKVYTLGQEVSSKFFHVVFLLYSQICQGHRNQLLVGVRDYSPLWVEMPRTLCTGGGINTLFDWLYLGCLILNFAGFLSGANPQQLYDRLLLPASDHWPLKEFWCEAGIEMVENKIACSLGYNTGFLNQADFQQILVKAELNRRYSLTPGYPVLVRLQEHPVVQQIIIMQKHDALIAKIQTNHSVDLIEYVGVNNGLWGGMTSFIKTMFFRQPESTISYAIPGLIAQIYHDLVTAETLVGTKKLIPSGKARPNHSIEAKTVTWKYIPRREYIKNGGEEVVNRRVLNEQEQTRQQQLNRFHEVCGHIRELKAPYKPSEPKLQEAKELGITLPEGYTWVKPHQRGLTDLAKEIDLSTIPHYLLRKTPVKKQGKE